MTKRTMPICCDTEQYKLIEKYAKKRGMINASQAVEKILEENQINKFFKITFL